MRKKITMLLASLFVCMGAMKAQFPTASTAPADGEWNADTKWYTITVNDKYVSLSYSDANGNLMLNSTTTPTGPQGLWCVVGSEAEGYQFYNMASGTAKVLGATGNEASGRMTMYDAAGGVDGVTYRFDITSHTDEKVYVKDHGTTSKYWNNRNSYLAYWNTNQALGNSGSASIFREVSLADFVATYKTSASTALDNITTVFDVDVTDAKAAVNAIDATDATTFAAIDAVVNGVLDGVAQYVAFRNADTSSANRADAYLSTLMADGKGHGTTTFNYLNALWSLKFSGGLCLYNAANDVYLGKPSSNGLLSKYSGIAYSLEKEDTKVVLRSNGETLHLNNHAGTGPVVSSGTFLSNYDENDIASRWYLETDLTPFVTTHKASAIAILDSWPTLSVVFDATLIETAKTAIEGFATTDYATFAAIDAELKMVTDDVAAKMLTFQTMATDNGRDGVWISANASTMKAFGAAKDAQDYNAVWSLQHAGGSSFYLYNELNKVYLGAPVNQNDAVVLTETPAAAYTLEMITDKGDNVVEMHSNGGTLHASNHDDDKLISYDGDQDASRWMVNVIDITKDIKDLLATIKEGDYAEVPALGQYSKVGYDALVAAQSTAKTIEEVEAAIAAFEAAKNVPVYFITSAWDDGYPAGKAILYNGSAWRFETANIYNKQMWMTIPSYAQANVPTVNAYDANGVHYEICDYLTGSVMRGKSMQIVAVDGWAGAYNLQYGTATNDAVQHAQNGGALVGWNPAVIKEDGTKDCGASAWNVEYIGSSYDLGKLSDEYFDAANQLAAVAVPGFNFAAGVNNYDPATKPALDAAVANRTAVLGKFSTAEEIAAAKTQLEAAIAGVNVKMNMPENGKFYRVRCAGTGMKYLQSTLDSSDADDIRLQMISGDDGKTVNATFCYVDGALLSYTTGQYINAYNYNEVGTKSTVTFSNASNGKVGAYNIMVGDRYIFGASDNNKIDSGKGTPDARDGYTWWLEEVTELPVVVSAAGFATLYVPVALTIADGVTAYTAAVEGETLVLNEVEGSTIPANTGVILEADPKTYNFAVAADVAAIEGNALVGSYAKSVKNANAKVYTLQKPTDKEVGFYLFKGQNGEGATTYINGFRAWVEVPNGGAAPAMFSLGRGEGTTSIDNVQLNDNVVIYDLAGRRVEKMEKGIYIVNGKKVVK